MDQNAAKEIAEGIAWLGFWLATGAVACTAIMNGWRPWE